MSTREAGDYLEDIFNSMLSIQEFTDGYSYDRFVADKKNYFSSI
ncbi:hypothetical protein [Methanolobus zinderi]|nr:hypothetical protein [Methanolobus zinderi]